MNDTESLDAQTSPGEKTDKATGSSLRRAGRWLARWNPLFMAWVSGMSAAFALANFMADRACGMHAMMAAVYGCLAVLLNTVKPPTVGTEGRSEAQPNL